jgi:diguanylate cyclase (GGDEF)-like protein
VPDDFDTTSRLSKSAVMRVRQPISPANPCLLVIGGPALGRLHRLTKQLTTMGRGEEQDIHIVDNGISRAHATVLVRDGEHVLLDAGSTNGVFVNGQQVQDHVLCDGDRIRIGATTIMKFSLKDEVEEMFQKQMYDSAVRDTLCDTYNRRFFMEAMATEYSYYARHRLPLSVMMIDIDHFKKLNDNYGHVAGDEVLKAVANLINEELRSEDLLCRYGGEEFAIILRTTSHIDAAVVAERIRKRIDVHEFEHQSQAMHVTVSIGIATLDGDNIATPEALVNAADQFLYQAKGAGRNRVASR